jgi:hypothetical protein
MPTTDMGAKTPLQDSVPQELISQIQVMRRNPTDFYFRRNASCSLGCDRKGERSAYQIGHPDALEAGTWCPTHGWLTFDSVALPPTERLLPWEIEDRRLAEQRRAAVARRKEAQQ